MTCDTWVVLVDAVRSDGRTGYLLWAHGRATWVLVRCHCREELRLCFVGPSCVAAYHSGCRLRRLLPWPFRHAWAISPWLGSLPPVVGGALRRVTPAGYACYQSCRRSCTAVDLMRLVPYIGLTAAGMYKYPKLLLYLRRCTFATVSLRACKVQTPLGTGPAAHAVGSLLTAQQRTSNDEQ